MEPASSSRAVVTVAPVALPLVPRTEGVLTRPQDPWIVTGTGRTLHEVYSALGQSAEKHANRVAHNMGLGPTAATQRTQTYFGDGYERESKLRDVSDRIPRKVDKDCSRLMEYALPCESSRTQLQAFKSLVMLTTRYPGLRPIFLQCKHIQHSIPSEDVISALWDRREDPDGTCSEEWNFYRHFAAACIADGDIWAVLDNVKTDTLVRVDGPSDGLCVVERLVVASDCEGISKFSSNIAVRYLGGILELPSFWLQTGQMFSAVIKKLVQRVLIILRDLGVDSLEIDESTAATVHSDPEGVDILCLALLDGVQNLILGGITANFAFEEWYPGFQQLIQLLRHPRAEAHLPVSYKRATSQILERLIPPVYRPETVDILVPAYAVFFQFYSPLVKIFRSPSSPNLHDSDTEVYEDLPIVTPAKFTELPLLSTDLPQTTIQVSSAALRLNDRGKPLLHIAIQVNPANKHGWTVIKTFPKVLELDKQLNQGRKTSLPLGKLWQDPAPLSGEKRKSILESYLTTLLSRRLPADLGDELISFLTSNVDRSEPQVERPEGQQGYLAKRGKNLGGWYVRYFEQDGPVLDYFEHRGGRLLGSIPITDAQLGRQRGIPDDDRGGYRHAFLIVEKGTDNRHVLCAESEVERDRWLESLCRWCSGSYDPSYVLSPSPTVPITKAPVSVLDLVAKRMRDGRMSTM
ncbi:hypothetical protein C8J57DRAFT_346729 [Mycena rebaudengoi]|nr:hypothetical protein C8J57DRAFT_346729 [Mycena rebaudengoi]